MKLDLQDFLAKVDWEGGTVESLYYGLNEESLDQDTPIDIRQAWYDVVDAWKEFAPVVDRFEQLAENYRVEPD